MGKHRTTKHKKMCSPESCDSCIYLGDGDFACDRDDYVIVMENWEPTDEYLHCTRKGKK